MCTRPLGTARAGILRLRRARLAALGSLALPGSEADPCAPSHCLGHASGPPPTPCTIPPPSAPQEALCTGKGAAARRERAVEAGWLELLIRACSAAIKAGEGDEGGGGGGGGQGEGEDGGGVEGGVERTPAVGMARAALRSITRDSMQLQQAALDAGALRQWLL